MAELEKTDKMITYHDLEEIIFLLQSTSGYDLSNYSKSYLKRRVQRFLIVEEMDVMDLKNAIINSKHFDHYFIQELVINLTEMFRDPDFYDQLKELVLPYLSTYPQVRIWSAGCSSGEEAFSLAILLNEEKLLDRSFIYATDISYKTIEIAKKGIYPTKKIKEYTANYNKTSMHSDFSSHYTAKYDAVIINNEYRNKILFSIHNLVSDQVFNEFQLILCRNVMIYFDRKLQERVLNLLYESLPLFGFLCLGSKESLFGHSIKNRFKVIDKKFNIYQKIA